MTVLSLDMFEISLNITLKPQLMNSSNYSPYWGYPRGHVLLQQYSQKACYLYFQVWAEIEVETRSNIQLHVYRESDIPNRHGHCNSNPYIPNALRLKLGMPLLKDGNRVRVQGSRRYKIKK